MCSSTTDSQDETEVQYHQATGLNIDKIEEIRLGQKQMSGKKTNQT